MLLGANYGPCMRRDRLLFDAIEQDRQYEADQSGCCVRRDGSGCVQVARERDCPNRVWNRKFNFTCTINITFVSNHNHLAVVYTVPSMEV